MNSAQRKEDVRFTAEILAELRGVVNLVPDHSNKVNVTKKWIVHIFGFSVHKKVIFEIESSSWCMEKPSISSHSTSEHLNDKANITRPKVRNTVTVGTAIPPLSSDRK